MKSLLVVELSALVIMAGLAIPSALAGDKEGETAAKVSLVHCLLPSMVRKYGGDTTQLAPRRVVQIAAAECHDRGGEVVVVEPEP